MPSKNENTPRSLVIVYISVFAALNAWADLVRFTPILGVPGASLSLGWILSPLTGILLGRKIGGISCLIGGLMDLLVQPPAFGPFTPLRPAISASIAGMLASKHWRTPAMTLFAMILVWLLLPTGRDAFMILIFHVMGFAAILSFRGIIGDLIGSRSSKRAAWGLFLAAYCGNISRHLFGNILLVTILDLPPVFFVAAIPYTLIEQSIFATGTAILGTPLNHRTMREFLRLG